MNRVEAMEVIAAARGNAAAVTGPGSNSGLLYAHADAPATIYNMDMGYATAVGLGMALARPSRRVLAIEGDGSFYAGSHVLSTIWRQRPENLVVVILDNNIWGTGDGKEPTATAFGVDLAALALVNGWDAEHVHRASDVHGLRDRLKTVLQAPGPHFICAKTDATADSPSSPTRLRPQRHQLDCAVLTRADLARDA
jgi:thiamine pyrophosphate-dependent acetolactate synthase large subunit-like protein